MSKLDSDPRSRNDDMPIMDKIREINEWERRQMGWWGRWLEDHYKGELCKVWFMPWLPTPIAELIPVGTTVIAAMGLALFFVRAFGCGV